MGKPHYKTALVGLVTGSSLLSTFVQAAPPPSLSSGQLDWQPWGAEAPSGALCQGRYVMPAYLLPPGETPQQVRSSADSANYGEAGETTLSGEVVLRRGDSQLEAPQLSVNAGRDTLSAEGPLTLRSPGMLVRGDAAKMSLDSDAANIDSAHYVAHRERLRGDAQRLQRLEDGRYRLSEASFTTCEPDDNTWRLVSKDILLDREQGFGTAKHARLEVGKVPIFYWPWVRFPIDDRRQSGFLWPTLGFSGDSFDYAQPYYFNLGPNYDATLTPRWLTQHGLLLGGEFRYLFGSDAGIVEGAYLADDNGGKRTNPNDPSDAFDGEDRWYIDYRHQGRFSPRTNYQLRYGAASDGRYFDDFGRTFGEQDTQFMSRLALLDYRGDTWQLEAKAQGYQRLEYPLVEKDKPFYRLPSLSANAYWSQDSGFYQQWRSNATYFWRDVNENLVPVDESANGTRLHLSPALGWRKAPTWGFLEPRLEMLYTAYSLDYGARDTARDEDLTRTVPVTSIDAGLYFERNMQALGDSYRQTLEPRLYYAYVPGEEQSDFPDFDTDELAFSWNQLWSPYRFTGVDRVGDVNKISYGVSTRFLEDDTGRERLTLSLGQSTYFDDRNIDMFGDPDTLPNKEVNYEEWYRATRDRSPLVTRLDWQINDRWSTRYEWLYDDKRERTEQNRLAVNYRHPDGHVLNLGYRWQLEGFDPVDEPEDRLGYNREEFDASFAWKANAQFDLIGRFLYDNTNDRALEQLAGVQWNDCCYGLQLVWREWIEDNDTANTIEDDYKDRGIFLNFVFKGLGGAGQSSDAYFEKAIPGYRPTSLN